jgi:hypothetical protein
MQLRFPKSLAPSLTPKKLKSYYKIKELVLIAVGIIEDSCCILVISDVHVNIVVKNVRFHVFVVVLVVIAL